MMSSASIRSQAPREIWSDLLLVAFLIAFAAIGRMLPHAPNFAPVAAAALFAGTVLHSRLLALAVPVAAMALSDLALGGDDWRVSSVIYVAIALPAVAGMLARQFRTLGKVGLLVPAMLCCSLIFFAASNLAVWAFSGMYAPDMNGLIRCYVAALPFLQYTVAGDLFWAVILFGGYWLAQAGFARARPA